LRADLQGKRIKALSTSFISGAETLSPQSEPSQASRSEMILQNILSSLEDAKAEDVIAINLQGKTALADQMIIVTGRSSTHVGSIADKAIKACKASGIGSPRVEGMPQCDWVLIDAGDVIIHVFRPEVRQFYNLEKMWGGDRPVETRPV
jgi:ribosome-associated protein